MVLNTHGDDSPNGYISGVGISADIHKNKRLSGELTFIREGRRWSSDSEVSRRIVDIDLLFGMGGDDLGVFLEILCLCGRRRWDCVEEKRQSAARGGFEGLAMAFPGLD